MKKTRSKKSCDTVPLNFVFTKVDYEYQKRSEFMLILKPLRKMQKIDLKNIIRQFFGGESQRVVLGYRDEIQGAYLSSQQERTLQHCT